MRPPGRDLTHDELLAYVRELAARPQLWAPRVKHDPDARIFRSFELDAHVETWVISWMAGHDTGFHDHDMSSGAVAVVRGAVREDRLRIGARPASRVVAAGGSFSFDPTDIHRVSHHGTDPAVSVHAYSPPLRRMGAYIVEDGGTLSRRPLGYGEELRSLDAVPS